MELTFTSSSARSTKLDLKYYNQTIFFMGMLASAQHAVVSAILTNNSLYVPVFKVGVGFLAAIHSVVNFVASLASVQIAMFVDRVTTPWGRRLPVIVVSNAMLHVSVFSMLYPPQERSIQQASRGILPEQVKIEDVATNSICSMVKNQLNATLHQIAHPQPSEHVYPKHVVRTQISLYIWIGFCFLANNCLLEASLLAFCSLALELTPSPEQRVVYLQVKNVIGNIYGVIVQFFIVFLAGAFATDMRFQAFILTFSAVSVNTVVIAAAIFLLHEKQGFASVTAEQPNLVSTIRTIMRDNEVFRLLMRQHLVALLAEMLPGAMWSIYLSNVLHIENLPLTVAKLNMCSTIAGMFLIPLVMHGILIHGKKKIQICNSFMHGCATLILAGLPRDVAYGWKVIYVYSIVTSISKLIGSYIIPDLLRGELIDYDSVLSGKRRPAIYISLSSQLEQLCQTFASLLPAFILSYLGYLGNGGCKCGCGVKCRSPHERWHCPGDVGYACTGDLADANPPFFGDVHRLPPCTIQPPAVTWLVFCSLVLGASLQILNIAFVLAYPIDEEMHKRIMLQASLRTRGLPAVDPITKLKLARITNSHQQYQDVLDTFASSELEALKTLGVNAFVRALLIRLSVFFMVGLLAVLIALHAGFNFLSGKTVTLLLSVILVVLTAFVWHSVKLHSAFVAWRTLHHFSNMSKLPPCTSTVKGQVTNQRRRASVI